MMEWDCPTQVVSAFAESWLSDGSCAPIVTEWLSLKLNEVDSEKDSLCTYHGMCVNWFMQTIAYLVCLQVKLYLKVQRLHFHPTGGN